MTLIALWALACGSKDTGEHTGETAPPTETGETATSSTDLAFAPSAVWNGTTNDWEPFTAADPNSPWVYQVTTRIDGPDVRIAFRASDDGGATWGDDTYLGDESALYDPFVAVAGETGCVFAGWLFPYGVWKTYVASSCDHGETWSTPVVITDWSSDHGWLLVSPDGNDVYVGFNGTAPGADEDAWQAAVVASHDGGATFGPPFVVGDGGPLYWFQTGGAVAPDGTVYYAAAQYTHDYTGRTTIGVWRSTDGGATFAISEVDTAEEPPACAWAAGCEFGYLAAQAAVAVDADGALLLVTQQSDDPGAHQAMVAWRSPGGEDWEDWTGPVVLGAADADNAFPTAVGARDVGGFRVAWQANRAEDPTDWNTWYQRTNDGGATWLPEPIRLSDVGMASPHRDADGYRFPYGDYIAISVDQQGLDHVIWAEGASYNGPGGTWFTRGLAPE